MAEAVVSDRVPYVTMTLEIPELSFAQELEALVDTGFTHGVAIPRAFLPPGATALTNAAVRMTDGERRYVPAYLGKVQIGGAVIDCISVFELGDEPVVGLDSVTQFHVTIDHDLSMTFEP